MRTPPRTVPAQYPSLRKHESHGPCMELRRQCAQRLPASPAGGKVRPPPAEGKKCRLGFPRQRGRRVSMRKGAHPGKKHSEGLGLGAGLGEYRRGQFEKVVGMADLLPIRHDFPEALEEGNGFEHRDPPGCLGPRYVQEEVFLEASAEPLPAPARRLGYRRDKAVGLGEERNPPVGLPRVDRPYQERARRPV